MADHINPKLHKRIYKGMLGLTLFIFFGAIYLAAVFATSLYWALAALPLAVVTIWLYFRYKKLAILAELRNTWGYKSQRKREITEIAALHKYQQEAGFTIDEQTWDDLNMDSFYALIDRTLTLPGESVLYHLLRTPSFSEEALAKRNKIITRFQQDQSFRESVQIELTKLKRPRDNSLTQLLWGKRPQKSALAPVYTLLALAALFSLLTPFIWGARGVFLIMMMFSLNSYIHYKVSKTYSYQIPAISTVSSLLRAAGRIAGLSVTGLEEYQKELAEAARAGRKIIKKTRWLFNKVTASDFDFIYDYLKLFFLMEVRSFYGAIEEINRQVKHLQSSYIAIGTIDALQSVASYRTKLEYSEPKFVSEKMLDLQSVRHPLLEKPVANSITISDQGILITGTNMSGKSTFLRTIGINALMAQTICTTLATSYRGSFVQIISSINKADNIAEGKSFYFAEAERLRTIIAPEYKDYPALCLIDELLSGTNYLERLAASRAILAYLKRKNALVIVATHDLDLADELPGEYQCYHFSDKVDKSGLDFDFTLKEGVAKSRNAIKLLEYLGYPKQIIEQANKAIQ
ncbi:MAG: MutS family DNA mismatch repair protein [Firmicutes bacterium]|nr:MutS family DNA mismatch repair protein [Bacillota bacterium]